ncbi:unnamed protein product, partial [Musa banksii]
LSLVSGSPSINFTIIVVVFSAVEFEHLKGSSSGMSTKSEIGLLMVPSLQLFLNYGSS